MCVSLENRAWVKVNVEISHWRIQFQSNKIKGGVREWRQWEEGKADGAWCVPELAATSQGDGANCSAVWDGRLCGIILPSQQFRKKTVKDISSGSFCFFSLTPSHFTPKACFLLHIWAVCPSLLTQLLQKPNPTACEHWSLLELPLWHIQWRVLLSSWGAMRAGNDRKAEDSSRDQGSLLS